MPQALSVRSPDELVERGLVLGPLALGQLGPEHLHGLGLVLGLAALVLAGDDDAGGQVGERTAESVLFTCWPPAPDDR